MARRSVCNLLVQRIRLCLYNQQIWNENENEDENEDENERDAGEMVEIVMKLTEEIHCVANGKKHEFWP